MTLDSVINSISLIFSKGLAPVLKIPGNLLAFTASRRPGLSSILASAEIFGNFKTENNDEIVKNFTYNLVDEFKTNIQDDSVCFVAIPKDGLEFKLLAANAMGPIELEGKNQNVVFFYAIIR